MLAHFKNHLTHQLPFLYKSRLLLAVSGGLDSMALTHLCFELQLNVAIAHCNFNLRGDESNADEAFVIKLADELHIEVFSQKFDTLQYAQQHKLSIQMAARELRYNWFKELATALNFDFILTAHHADDNLETFLINFLRGTGLHGLTGIPPVNDNIVRPLLPFSRADIENYLKTANITWREDSSNQTTKYLRNKLRHEVIPVLKSINPQLLDSFQNTIHNLNDIADIVDESLNAVAKRAIVAIDEFGISYKISEFKKVNNPRAYLYQMFKDFGFTAWDDILHLLDAESGKQVFSDSHVLLKHRDVLILSERMPEIPSEIIEISANENLVATPFGRLCFETVSHIEKATETSVFLNAESLLFPLKLRIWEAGDYFYPSGMTGKKKVSKYLKDEKISLLEKSQIWVLTSENKIVWIVGKRLDNRFIANNQTANILKISMQ